ncbi:MAG: hypothetical protein BroJett021_16080 [Chloroflexota bacterium]|nr:sulfotransferase [Caldilinea sp.]GIK72620.1 MAG: hypothetical protein BroJett021_16080 [Chloroflexota bacterium]
MKNCIILGCGRSGTSLVAAIAQRSGYFLGDPLQPPNAGNPLGRFESFEVNAINEALLAQVTLPRPRGWLGNLLLRHVPRPRQRWLAAVPVGRKIKSTAALTERMARLTAQQPYCFKDPRFSYTLSAWRPVLAETRFVCLFRHPAATAQSILRECQEEPGLRSLAMDFNRALRVWTLMYRHILERHCQAGEWLFVHYEQILAGDGVERLAAFLDADLDLSLINPAMRRSQPEGVVPDQTQQLYRSLCMRAEWTES